MKKWYRFFNCLVILGIFAVAIYYDSSKISYGKEEDDLINISELSEEFMDNYFAEVAELNKEDNKDNILIITSTDGIENNYGATRVVEAPNHQYFLQYENE